MEDLLIVVGVGVGLYVLKKHLDAQNAAAAATAGQGLSSIPTALGVSTAPTTSAAYQTAAPGTGWVMGYGSPPSSGTVPAPPPVPQPPPPFYGGTVGSVGSGGNPLGGALRAGVSAGTGTTVPMRATPVSVLPADTTLAGTRATLSAGHR
jgi:hypothetical protein